jgi:uncharacterized membrane protein
MRHGNYISFYYGEWMIVLLISGALVIIVGLIWFLHNRNIASDGLTPLERKNFPPHEKEILSMLRQNNGPMRQDEIVDALPGDLEMLSEVLKDMATKGLIRRRWESEQGTYLVLIYK